MSEEQSEYKIDGRPHTIFHVVHDKDNPYVMVDRRIIDNIKLSFKAKGILIYLLSRPDGWEVNLIDLANRSLDGLSAVKSGVKELKDAGHLKHAGTRKASGQFETVIWEVYECPQVGNQLTDALPVGVSPQVDYPQVENPQADNRTQVLSTLSSNESSTEKQKTRIKEAIASKGGLDWQLHMGATSEQLADLGKKEVHAKEILDAYEKSMGYNPLDWNKLERLQKFLLTKTVDEIQTFAKWCKRDFSSLRPEKVRQNPQLVIDCWNLAFEPEPEEHHYPTVQELEAEGKI